MEGISKANMVEDEAGELVPCFCKFCSQSEFKPAAECVLEERVRQHMSDVVLLGQNDPTVKLLVGPEKTEYNCHKLLLSFYSTFFDKSIFGSPKGMISGVLNFPACSKREMDAFVAWMVSGRLDRRPNQKFPCVLWVFGKKFGVPLLQNDAIKLLCDNVRNSALKVPTTEVHRTDWVNLIAAGGDFMKEVAEFGLHNDNKQQAPWTGSNFRKYLQLETDRSLTSWKMTRVNRTPERPGSTEKRQHVEEQRGLKRTSSGIEGHQGMKKQKDSIERTPTRQNAQTPAAHNIRNLNTQQWQAVVRVYDYPPKEQDARTPVRQNSLAPSSQKFQTPARQNGQTPTQQYHSPSQNYWTAQERELYIPPPPFQTPVAAAEAMDTDSWGDDDDNPLRDRKRHSRPKP